MLPTKSKYILLSSILISASLLSTSVHANTDDGVFGDYFRNIMNTPTISPCATGYGIVTGFDSSPGTSYGTKQCKSIQDILAHVTSNVGIGIITPTEKLDVAGNIKTTGNIAANGNITATGSIATNLFVYINYDSPGISFHETDKTGNGSYWRNVLDAKHLRFDVSSNLGMSPYNTVFSMSENGNVGIGNDTYSSMSTAKLEVAGTTDNIIRLNKLGTSKWNYMEWSLAGTRKYWTGLDANGIFTIQSDNNSSNILIAPTGGNVGIGTSSPTEKLQVTGNIKASGGIEANGFFYTSDKRLKEHISPLSNSLDKILSLNGYSYDWKSTGRKDIGVIAQEVETVFPELVKTNPDTGFKSVEYANLVAPLIESIKEQQKEIDTLRTEIKAIKSQLK